MGFVIVLCIPTETSAYILQLFYHVCTKRCVGTVNISLTFLFLTKGLTRAKRNNNFNFKSIKGILNYIPVLLKDSDYMNWFVWIVMAQLKICNNTLSIVRGTKSLHR